RERLMFTDLTTTPYVPLKLQSLPCKKRVGHATDCTITSLVQPNDAEILIDGERCRVPDAQESLVVGVAEGRHTNEVQKSGFRTYVTEVQVRRGETTTVNVSLRTQDEP